MNSALQETPRPVSPAGPGGATPARKRSLLLFHLAGLVYALPLPAVQEVVPMALLARPPGLPSLLAGFLNLGGRAIPVLHLDRLFGLPALESGLYTPLVILRDTGGPLALLVATVSRIVTVPGDSLVPLRGNDSFNDCAEGTVTLDADTALVLRPERILLEKERQCLAELEAAEQDRLRGLEEAGP